MLRFYCDWEPKALAHNLCEKLGLDPLIHYERVSDKWHVDHSGTIWLRVYNNGIMQIVVDQRVAGRLEDATNAIMSMGFEPIRG